MFILVRIDERKELQKPPRWRLGQLIRNRALCIGSTTRTLPSLIQMLALELMLCNLGRRLAGFSGIGGGGHSTIPVRNAKSGVRVGCSGKSCCAVSSVFSKFDLEPNRGRVVQ